MEIHWIPLQSFVGSYRSSMFRVVPQNKPGDPEENSPTFHPPSQYSVPVWCTVRAGDLKTQPVPARNQSNITTIVSANINRLMLNVKSSLVNN